MIRVLIGDNHALLRRRTRQAIADVWQGCDIGEACSLEELRSLTPLDHWDAIVLDLALARGQILEVVRWLRGAAPHTPLVVLTMDDDAMFVQRLRHEGIAGVVAKRTLAEQLIPVLMEALSSRFPSGSPAKVSL